MNEQIRSGAERPLAVSSGGWLDSFKQKRTLTEYPTGAYRWTLLLLTVLAVILISYEFQLAPVLSLLLPFLHMSKLGYGYFVSAALLISAVSAFIGGPLADRYGRVLIIDFCLAVITIMVFSNLLIVGIKSFSSSASRCRSSRD